METNNVHADAPPAALRKSLSVVDGVVLAASSTAATTTIGIGLGVLALVTGRQTPAIVLIAFLPMLGIAGAYARLNRIEPDCGAGYAWVNRSLGPWLGTLAGWVPLAAGVVFLAYTTSVTGSVLLQFAHKAGLTTLLGRQLDPNSTLQCTLLGLLVLAGVTWTAVTGVHRATRFQTYLLVFEYAVLLLFCGWGFVAGQHPFSFSWFNPFGFDSLSGFAQGLVLGVFFYWGWETAFNVTEETKEADASARGGYITLFTMLGLFLLGSTAFQRVMTEEEMSSHGAEGLAYFASRLAGEPLATLPLVALLFSAVASLQAGIIPTARLGLSMSRERTLGPAWGRISERYGSPTTGTLIVTGTAAALALLTVVIPKVSEAILASVNAIGIVVALTYALTAFACAARFRYLLRTDPRQAVLAVVVPVVCGLILIALGGYLAFYYATLSDTFAVDVDNGWFNLVCPGVLILCGLASSAIAKWYRRAPCFSPSAPATDPQEPGTGTESELQPQSRS
ncbi:APC family permease [Streptomyces maremycinicus]|uniref:APC family permease n=1 Tax=Streptomyces maremycinicus TaxID=1679753 RepID=UPI0007C71236|nr:APC family permease [Streptomyces sp. NBRC 110468]